MADACNSANLPGSVDLYASYVDGACAVNRGDAVRISSRATNAGNVGDVEPGNAGWPTWISWVVARRAAGVDPTLYCIDDGQDEGSGFWAGWHHRDGVAAFARAGVAQPHWWVAHPNGDSSIPAYAVAAQYAYLGSYDLSAVVDHWPGVDVGGIDVPLTPADQPIIAAAVRAELNRAQPSGYPGGDGGDWAKSWIDTYGRVAGRIEMEALRPTLVKLDAISTTLAAIPVGGGLTAAQAAQISDLETRVTDLTVTLARIEAGLRGA